MFGTTPIGAYQGLQFPWQPPAWASAAGRVTAEDGTPLHARTRPLIMEKRVVVPRRPA
ncbi:MAG: hypothetical protein ACRDY7_06320 [Acidimicrobiia bacterium]